jgi:hypothetical protein
MTDGLPIFGVCGGSGAGRATMVELLVAALAAGGLKVAVVERDVQGAGLDVAGADSSRFFRTGANVLIQGGAASRVTGGAGRCVVQCEYDRGTGGAPGQFGRPPGMKLPARARQAVRGEP